MNTRYTFCESDLHSSSHHHLYPPYLSCHHHPVQETDISSLECSSSINTLSHNNTTTTFDITVIISIQISQFLSSFTLHPSAESTASGTVNCLDITYNVFMKIKFKALPCHSSQPVLKSSLSEPIIKFQRQQKLIGVHWGNTLTLIRVALLLDRSPYIKIKEPF